MNTELTTELAVEQPLFGRIGKSVVDVHSITGIEPVEARLDDDTKIMIDAASIIHLNGTRMRVNASVDTILQWRDQIIEHQRQTAAGRDQDELDHSENDA